ncbi:carbohydrate ABC transporter permease [Clostridium lacusfryxellense]|uniref:carbohydrate ABC transporter permease n=1 Tax=Clostridium lacusfryxellense TaxID=205328 RepID=UPI001C0E6E1B|nr:carbohydrate ABC transporter permease [Clostridium lacusfryxellense]MBU3110069.1 carbohydrate ABC transporter permease [Clostridium lacusfryxellense]
MKANSNYKNVKFFLRIFLDILKWIFIISMVIFTLFPVIYIILGSFKSNNELMIGGNIIPKVWNLTNYIDAWQKANFAIYTWNSLYFCVFVTVGALLISSMAGYVLARKEFYGKKIFKGVLLSTMFITLGAIVYKPLYIMMVSIGLNNSMWAIILIQIGAQGMNIFIVERFVKGIPKELDEAAKIDGCSSFRIYWQIIIPLIRPILGVVGLFSFRDAWNSYVLPSIFSIMNRSLMTLTVGVVNLKYADGAAIQWNIMVAGASIALIPMLIVYIFASKQFISGLTVGGVKG